MGRDENAIKGLSGSVKAKVTVLSKPGAAVRVERIDLPESILNSLTARVDMNSLPSFSADNSTPANTAEAGS